MVTLTKSRYVNGVQCPAYLWMQVNTPDKIPPFDDGTKHRMNEGIKVGILATRLYADGIKIPDKVFNENILETGNNLKNKKPLFEAGFKLDVGDDSLYARIDILIPASKNKWDIVEVKSGTKVKDINVHDVSFQKYVCENLGIKINKCYLMHINSDYVRKKDINLEELFVLDDITSEVKKVLPNVEDKIKTLLNVLKLDKCPPVEMKDLLEAEYNNVAIDDFYNSLPEHNIFKLYRLATKKKVELYEKGIIKIEDITSDVKLNTKQQIQKDCIGNNCEYKDEKKIKKFIDKLKYPHYYLDFETFNEAIPRFEGTKPYQQIPFQFSLHIVEKEGSKPKHVSFLAEGGKDPRKSFAQALKDNLGDDGDIIVYNQSFEKKIIKETTEFFEEYDEWGKKVLLRIVDLLVPFRSFHFYHPKQNGSASIKKVLPIFSKELKYDDLVIGNGEDASISYLHSHFGDDEISDKEKNKIREALEKYCELDTLAEVVILDELKKNC